jgi:hypothetical protein
MQAAPHSSRSISRRKRYSQKNKKKRTNSRARLPKPIELRRPLFARRYKIGAGPLPER